ncbi:MAG: SpoIIE family protein phosphatase, partial [Acidobacteriota bacterium]|nr:SpoIIE family protein phosphatase [Acidobacteriota bacterium]
DRLVLFTDGITEAERADAEMFGEDRLIDLLREGARRPAAEVEPAIMEAVSTFSAGELRDDATLVVVAAM